MRDAWTAERVDLLRRLWAEGATAAVIAARLAMSRSAVMGKVFRLRLNAGGTAASAPKRPKPAAATSPARRPRRKRTPPPSPPPTTTLRPPHKTLLELTNTSCRWPHGRPGAKNFFFCGKPEADLERGIPYCAHHMRRAYAPQEIIGPAETETTA